MLYRSARTSACFRRWPLERAGKLFLAPTIRMPMKPDEGLQLPVTRPSAKQILRVLVFSGGVVGLCVIIAHGCATRPHAPVLSTEPVYENRQEGFRFLPPDGWVQYARREYPPG